MSISKHFDSRVNLSRCSDIVVKMLILGLLYVSFSDQSLLAVVNFSISIYSSRTTGPTMHFWAKRIQVVQIEVLKGEIMAMFWIFRGHVVLIYFLNQTAGLLKLIHLPGTAKWSVTCWALVTFMFQINHRFNAQKNIHSSLLCILLKMSKWSPYASSSLEWKASRIV